VGELAFVLVGTAVILTVLTLIRRWHTGHW
jgi:hypothetical protein